MRNYRKFGPDNRAQAGNGKSIFSDVWRTRKRLNTAWRATASSGIDPACCWLAGPAARLLHSRTRPLEKRVVEGERKEKERGRGRKLLSTLLAFSGVNSGTRVILMLEWTRQKVVHLTTNTAQSTLLQSVLAQVVTLLACIRKVPNSNLGPNA
jgi:hypothetical protein